jgi:hypothetical protein
MFVANGRWLESYAIEALAQAVKRPRLPGFYWLAVYCTCSATSLAPAWPTSGGSRFWRVDDKADYGALTTLRRNVSTSA